jgi:hypothetical protein
MTGTTMAAFISFLRSSMPAMGVDEGESKSGSRFCATQPAMPLPIGWRVPSTPSGTFFPLTARTSSTSASLSNTIRDAWSQPNASRQSRVIESKTVCRSLCVAMMRPMLSSAYSRPV